MINCLKISLSNINKDAIKRVRLKIEENKITIKSLSSIEVIEEISLHPKKITTDRTRYLIASERFTLS